MSWSVEVKLVRKEKNEVKVIYDEWVDELKHIFNRANGWMDEELSPWFSANEMEMTDDVIKAFQGESDNVSDFEKSFDWKFYTAAGLTSARDKLENRLCDVVEKMKKIDTMRGTLDYMKLSSEEKGNVDEEYNNLKEYLDDIRKGIYPLAFLVGLFYPYWDIADEKTYLGIRVR